MFLSDLMVDLLIWRCTVQKTVDVQDRKICFAGRSSARSIEESIRNRIEKPDGGLKNEYRTVWRVRVAREDEVELACRDVRRIREKVEGTCSSSRRVQTI